MGSIHKEPNGTWRVIYNRPGIGRLQTSKRGFRTKREAADFLRDTETSIKNKAYVAMSEITFADYVCSVWMPQELDAKIADGRKSIGTKNFYIAMFSMRFKQYFNTLRLQDLTDSHISAYLDFLRSTGKVTENTVYAHFKAIRTVLRHAVRHSAISRNPMDTVDPPRYSKPAINFWQPEMIPAALKLFEKTEIEWHVKIALLTLLRESEICALHEDWFDYKSKEFTVKEQTKVLARGNVTFVRPKSEASAATLPLTGEVAELVRSRSCENKKSRLQYGGNYSEEYRGRLSVREDGTLIRPQTVYRKFKAILKAQDDIPYITFHGLRHTGAVWHIERGTQLKVLQRLLRHADFATTVDIYADISKRLLMEAAESISLL